MGQALAMTELVANGRRVAPVRVVVADDHALMRADLARMLARFPGLEVVGTAADGAEAVALVEALHPDVVLMDIRMPHMDGLQATRIIRRQGGTAVVLVSTYDVSAYAGVAAEAGAAACLPKITPEEVLARAVLEAGRRGS